MANLREGIEIVHTSQYATFLQSILPIFVQTLTRSTKPNNDTESIENKIRRVTLEILHRLPCNDTLRPHASTILSVSMDVLKNDYEENALIAIKITFDLHKTYRPMLQV